MVDLLVLSKKSLDAKTIYRTATDPIERLHIPFLKWTLLVGKGTSNVAVWGDCGRAPLVIRLIKHLMDYCNRPKLLLDKSPTKLVSHAFVEQRELNLPWFRTTTNLGDILHPNTRPGYLHNALLTSKRAHERFVEVWDESRKSNRKLGFYNSVKTTFKEEPYLMTTHKNCQATARLRTSGHKLNVETGRYGYKRQSIHHRVCEYCSDISEMEYLTALPFADPIIEDEIHVLRTCPRFHHIRLQLKDSVTVKSLLFSDPSLLFIDEHVGEASAYLPGEARSNTGRA